MAIATLSMKDEITAIRALVLRPTTKTPGAAWAAFSAYMRTKHGITDITSPAGEAYLAQFSQNPGMKALLDYMLRRTPS
jgi:hypothetical protein